MSAEPTFAGFRPEGLTFLRDLPGNNDRAWFAAHRATFEAALLEPARAFVVALGARLRTIDAEICSDPRTDGTGVLMRINRDTRFSPDKSPYKTELSGLFWDGRGKKTERPAFGFRLTADGLDLMTGLFAFPPPLLDAYRAAVADERRGRTLEEVLTQVRLAGPYELAGEQSKRVPAGFPPDHPRADLLRHRGLYAASPRIPAERVGEPSLVETGFGHFEAMAPLYRWLADL
jgi:uncharacterized protein (TIGR02453 family)